MLALAVPARTMVFSMLDCVALQRGRNESVRYEQYHRPCW